jgi:hypothetical protein
MAKLVAGRRYAYTWKEYRSVGANGPIHVPEKTVTYTVNWIEGRHGFKGNGLRNGAGHGQE